MILKTILISSILYLLFTTAQQVLAAQSCKNLYQVNNSESSNLQSNSSKIDRTAVNFDFRVVVRSKGLNPNDLHPLFTHLTGNVAISLQFKHQGENIGSLIVTPVDIEGKSYWESGNSFLKQEFRGKGIGAIMYLSMARYLHEKFGMQLVSTVVHTEDAEDLWYRLIQGGIATTLPVRSADQPRYIIDVESLLIASEDVFNFFVKPNLQAP